MDIDMPEIGGLEACQMIREYEMLENLSPVFIVIITAETGKFAKKYSLNGSGVPLFNKLFRKPVNLAEFDYFIKEGQIYKQVNANNDDSAYSKRCLIIDDDGFSLEAA